MPIVRPMLAATAEDETQIRYPCLVTPKIDGIRCVTVNGRARTRSFKLVRNDHVRETIESIGIDGLDGELVAGTDTEFNFQATTSAIMRSEGKPEFRYWVFDHYTGDAQQYSWRYQRLALLDHPCIVPVVPAMCTSPDQLLEFEAECLAKGFEGVMARSPSSPYKFGRSSLREQYLVKLKRFKDSEMRVTGFEERMHNTNEIVSDNFGYARRPGGAANHVPMDTLGGFIGEDVSAFPGLTVKVGSGMDDALRREVWQNQEKYLGKLVKYRYQPVGVKDKPRFPTFLGFRDVEDT